MKSKIYFRGHEKRGLSVRNGCLFCLYLNQMSRLSEAEANKLSVRLELLADFYAGVWAYHDNKMFGSLEDGDLEEAIRCASKQRMKWLKLGLQTGDIRRGTTFQCSDAEL